MVITANTLYDAVEPYAIWKRMFSSMNAALRSPDSELEVGKKLFNAIEIS